MEMHQVRYFLAVAETLNFTRAADQCNVAQPSLTRAIQKLEEELGGLLFHRERQNTHLTELGRLMLPHLERTYEAARSARDLARSIRSGEMAPLRVGVGAWLCIDRLVFLLEDLRAAVNGVEITLRQGPEDEICAAALEGEHDIIFVGEQPELPERMRAWRLYSDRGQVALPERHPLARKAEIELADLAGEELIEHVGIAAAARPGAEGSGEGGATASRLRFRHRIHSASEMAAMVRYGFGLGLLPSLACAFDGVALRPLAGEGPGRGVIVAVVAGRPFNRATEACLRLARNHAWSGGGSDPGRRQAPA